MSTDMSYADDGVNQSLEFLRTQFAVAERYSADPLYSAAVESLRTGALGGKHLRARLVHISAGRLTGQAHAAAVAFGGAIDLLHSSLLIHDDIIDSDPYRRGVPTIHSVIAQRSGDAHIGTSAGILAGDLGLIATFQALSTAQLSPQLAQEACSVIASYAAQTVYGELLDVSHLLEHDTSMDTVRESNYLKTSIYSFLAPLHLGALAAGEATAERIDALRSVADPLGRAYQAIDDIAGAVSPMQATGKVAGGDIQAGRTTLLTVRLDRMSLTQAVAEVKQEAAGYVLAARRAASASEIPSHTRAGLGAIIDKLEAKADEF